MKFLAYLDGDLYTQGLANLEVEVTNLAAKAGKGTMQCLIP